MLNNAEKIMLVLMKCVQHQRLHC